MASRKSIAHRRDVYSTRLVDVRTRPTRFARSADPATVDQVARDSQAFQPDPLSVTHREGCWAEPAPHVHRIHLLAEESPRELVGQLPLERVDQEILDGLASLAPVPPVPVVRRAAHK